MQIYFERQVIKDEDMGKSNVKMRDFSFLDRLDFPMSSSDSRYSEREKGSGTGRDSPPIVTPHYGSSLPQASDDVENARKTPCVTGVPFITSNHGILNIIIFVSENRTSIRVVSVI